MNIQHSSRSNDWYTPPEIIESARTVLNGIELDPASCAEADRAVKAERYYSSDALDFDWTARTVFVNPPGGKVGNRSQVALFWRKLMASDFGHAIFLAFNLEALQVTQGHGCPSIAEFPFCIPRKRIRFYRPGWVGGPAPSHSNVIAYIPRTIDRTKDFIREFSRYGVMIASPLVGS